jgi:hypothetical protein
MSTFNEDAIARWEHAADLHDKHAREAKDVEDREFYAETAKVCREQAAKLKGERS